MTMDHFEQQFRDQWNNRQEPEFQEGDWKLLQSQLQAKSSRRWPGWLLLLPWLGIGGLLYFLNHVHHDLQTLQANQSSALTITDTIVQIQERITHDTVHVYHTVIHRDTLFIQDQFVDSGYAAADPGSMQATFPLSPPGSHSSLKAGLTILPLPNNTAQQPLSEQEWRTLSGLSGVWIKKVQSAFPRSMAIPVEKMNVNHTPKVNVVRKVIYQMRPDGLAVSGEGSSLTPVGSGIRQATGYGIGIQGALLYGDHWEMGVGASFNQMSFEIQKFDAVLGVPAVDPPSESFDFVAAEVIRPFIALDLQGGYTLSGKSRLSPFFEGGLRVIITQPFDVLYDFQDPITGVTWTYETSPAGEIQLPVQAMLGAGLKYRLGSSWSLGLQGQYLYNLSRKNAVPNHVKAGGFLQYSF